MLHTNIERANKAHCFSFSLESTRILFESFCHLYSNNKVLLMKQLVKDAANMFQSWSDCSGLLAFVDQLIGLSFLLTDSMPLEHNEKLTRPLTELLNAVQANIFYKMKEQLDRCEAGDQAAGVRDNIQRLAVQMVALLVEKGCGLARLLLGKRRPKEALAGGWRF